MKKLHEARAHRVDAIKMETMEGLFNTTEGGEALADSRAWRRAAMIQKVPYYTTVAGAIAAAKGIEAYSTGVLEVRPLQSYFAPAE